MPQIVGNSTRVVDFEGLTIDELVGNVASKEDRISIAHVQVANPTSEPWLTLQYDEWMCVTKGRMVLLHGDGPSELEVKAGETVFIAKGERFRPTFPDSGTEYVPVCLPAFRPDRCHREEEGGESVVAAKLATLHTPKTSTVLAKPIDTLYHMCEVSAWTKAKKSHCAYFPPTFEADGNMTHATAVPARLIETANHFYTASTDAWVCLRFSRVQLRKRGIIVVDEEAKPVGDQAVGDDWGNWVCPHIMGGIPPDCVEAELPMRRAADGTFEGIEGVPAGEGEPATKAAKK